MQVIEIDAFLLHSNVFHKWLAEENGTFQNSGGILCFAVALFF